MRTGRSSRGTWLCRVLLTAATCLGSSAALPASDATPNPTPSRGASKVVLPFPHAAVNAYEESVYRQINKEFQAAVERHAAEINNGAVIVSFELTHEGLIQNVQMTPNRPSDSLNKYAFEIVRWMQPPPIPKDLTATWPLRFSVHLQVKE